MSTDHRLQLQFISRESSILMKTFGSKMQLQFKHLPQEISVLRALKSGRAHQWGYVMQAVGRGSWACLLSWAIAHFGNYVILLWHEALECALFIGRSLRKTYQGKASVGTQGLELGPIREVLESKQFMVP